MEANNTENGDLERPNLAAVNSYFISLIVLGTVGNLLIVVAFSSDKKLRRVTANIFIVHLAVVNLFAVTTVTPLFIYVIKIQLNTAASRFRDVVYPVTIGISLESLTVIAVNRYLLIRNNRKAYQRLCTGRALPSVLVTMWVLTVTNAVPLWINRGHEDETMTRRKIMIYLIINIFPTLIIVPIINVMTLRIVSKSRMRVTDASASAKKNPSTSARVACVSFADEKAEQKTTDRKEVSLQSGLGGCDNFQDDGNSKTDRTDEFCSDTPEEKVENTPKTILRNLDQQLDADLPLQQGPGSSQVLDISYSPSPNSFAAETNSRALETTLGTQSNNCDGTATDTQPCASSVMTTKAPESKENNFKMRNLVKLDKPKILRVGRGELKLMRLMLAMFGLLLISWVPTLIELFRQFESTKSLRNLSYYVYLVPVFPSFVPYIYLWSNIHFQRVLMKRIRLLCTICCCYTKASAERPETTFF